MCSIHSGPERGDPEEKQRSQILVNHGLLPARHVLLTPGGRQKDVPVQLVAQRLAGRQTGRAPQCEYLTVYSYFTVSPIKGFIVVSQSQSVPR